MLPEKTLYKPFLIAWNLTRECNLRCGHCYMDAGYLPLPQGEGWGEGGVKAAKVLNSLVIQTHPHPDHPLEGEGSISPSFPSSRLKMDCQVPAFEGAAAAGGLTELTLEEGFRLIDDIAFVNPETILVLTGGEPLLYPYTLDFAGYASGKGLMVVVGTNGILLDEPMIKRLKESGVSGVGLSLDSLDPSIHDAFRGYPGAWEGAVDAIERCRRQGLPFQIHHSVMSFNWREVPRMMEFAHLHGARVVNFFFMVCTGRGEKLTDITPQQYEEVLSTLVDLQAKYPGMMIRARCAPHFKRIAYQRDPHSPITKAEGYLGGGCLAGSHYCRIAPDGEITPCPYMPLSVGNVRRDRFPEIWESAAVFRGFRGPQLKGKCGVCEYEELCGGCRARPYASHGDYLDEDLWCQYEPAGGEKIGAVKMSEEIDVIWTIEAEERLNRLPFFLRSMIKGNVEKYAKEQGVSPIRPELLDELRRKRFGDKMPEIDKVEGGSEQAAEVRSKKLEVRSEKNKESVRFLPWTKEALRRLDAIPDFMKGMFKEVAEEFARDKGHLEVNVEVWEGLEELTGEKSEVRSQKQEARGKKQEEEDESSTKADLEWTEDALLELGNRYSGKPMFVKVFMDGIIKEDIEMFARSKGISRIDREVLRAAAEDGKASVEWSPEAWERLQNAPDFIRSGIRKAAERRAMRMGVTVLTSDTLTQFRNAAMMKAVKRIKALGYHELTFDPFDFAKENFKHIRDNVEAQERLDEIREYVTSKGKVGLMDEEMLSKMKDFLRK